MSAHLPAARFMVANPLCQGFMLAAEGCKNARPLPSHWTTYQRRPKATVTAALPSFAGGLRPAFLTIRSAARGVVPGGRRRTVVDLWGVASRISREFWRAALRAIHTIQSVLHQTTAAAVL